MKAYKVVNNYQERIKPLELLEDALKKLNHENLKIENMDINHYEKALSLSKSIMEAIDRIHSEIDGARYQLKKLSKK